MIVGIGTDIIDVNRIHRVIERNGAFVTKVFTPLEITYCNAKAAKAQSYAARFAAKEATMKALGTGWAMGISWLDIEVENNAEGKPVLRLSGAALARAGELGANLWHLSLSHEKDSALAFVILENA